MRPGGSESDNEEEITFDVNRYCMYPHPEGLFLVEIIQRTWPKSEYDEYSKISDPRVDNSAVCSYHANILKNDPKALDPK